MDADNKERLTLKSRRRRELQAGVVCTIRHLNRDRICYLCGKPLAGKTHMDHEPALDHRPLLCHLREVHAYCNQAKGNRPASEVMPLLRP